MSEVGRILTIVIFVEIGRGIAAIVRTALARWWKRRRAAKFVATYPLADFDPTTGEVRWLGLHITTKAYEEMARLGVTPLGHVIILEDDNGNS